MNAFRGGLLAAALCVVWAGALEAQNFGLATFSAVINKNGLTARGSAVQTSRRTGTGTYVIEFTREVVECSLVASPAGPNGGQASIVIQPGATNKIRVYTFSRTGQIVDLGFTVLVSCAS